jgi:hypothetical protein
MHVASLSQEEYIAYSFLGEPQKLLLQTWALERSGVPADLYQSSTLLPASPCEVLAILVPAGHYWDMTHRAGYYSGRLWKESQPYPLLLYACSSKSSMHAALTLALFFWHLS